VNAVLTGPLPDANDSFIVAVTSLRNIYQVDITTGATAQLLPFGTASIPVALAYDSTAKLVFWTDVTAHTINRYSLLTNSSTVIYRDPLGTGKDYASINNHYKCKKTKLIKDGNRRRSGTSKTANIHRFVIFVMYCFITTVPEHSTEHVVMNHQNAM